MEKNDIIAAVMDGMKKSANVAHFMNFESGGMITTEYLATVTIGSALVDSGAFERGDDKVIFECSTKKFLSSTVPFSKKYYKGEKLIKTIVRKIFDTSRPGRIDIAVMGNDSGFEYPKCAIEVKGNKPAKALFIEDVKRNIEYFFHVDQTGVSRLELALNCSFESFNRELGKYGKVVRSYAITFEDKKKYISETRITYGKYVSEALKGINGINSTIDVFSASEKLASSNTTQEEFLNIEDDIHLTLAILVVLERKKQVMTETP